MESFVMGEIEAIPSLKGVQEDVVEEVETYLKYWSTSQDIPVHPEAVKKLGSGRERTPFRSWWSGEPM